MKKLLILFLLMFAAGCGPVVDIAIVGVIAGLGLVASGGSGGGGGSQGDVMPPYITRAVFHDCNQNGIVDENDNINVIFSEPMDMNLADYSSFKLFVSGDTIENSSLWMSENGTVIYITLWNGNHITPNGMFDNAVTSAGSPSGIDVSAGTVLRDVNNNTAVQVGGVDIEGETTTILVPANAVDPVPSDGENGVLITTNLSWQAANRAEGYYVFMDTTDGSTYLGENTSATGFDPGELAYGITHYWKVIPYNLYGNASGVVIWEFETEEAPAGSIIFVSTTGDNSNDGTSWGKAVRTIQRGINLSGEGGKVYVADGTYAGAGNKNLDFGGKNLSLVSANGAECCIIDCEGIGRGFYFHNAEDNTSTIQGFTVSSAYVTDDNGAGVLCIASNPVFEHCIFENNTCTGSYPDGLGAGIFYTDSISASLLNCSFLNNSAHRAGGISSFYSNVNMTNCTFMNNTASFAGGFYGEYSNASFTKCLFETNIGSYRGGACFFHFSNLSIIRCMFKSNTTNNFGGAIRTVSSEVSINQTIFNLNTSGEFGGVFCDSNSVYNVYESVICNNSAIGSGGAIYSAGDDQYTFVNSIIWSNSAEEGNQSYIYNTGTIDYKCCCLDNSPGHWAGDHAPTFQDCIYTDPMFVNPANGNYHLQSSSPCIDAGCNTYVTEQYDLDNNTRIINGTVDIGAYESAAIVYVHDADGSDSNSGTSWTDAVATIQKGIDLAASGSAIYVADGTYTGAGNKNLDFGGKNLSLIGYNGADYCVIDCQGSGRGFAFQNGESNSSVIKGFTVEHAWGVSGGGLHCSGGSCPVITDCIFDNNQSDYGAGIYVYQSSPLIANCSFLRNFCEDGGGIYFDSANGTVTGCIFEDNEVEDGGGGIKCVMNSSPLISRCVFKDNTARRGGGLAVSISSSSVVNCVFQGNNATEIGGGIRCYDANMVIVNCTLAGNISENGGGLSTQIDRTVEVRNSIIWSNYASGAGNEVYCAAPSSITISYCNLDNSSGEVAGTGVVTPSACISSVPAYVNTALGSFRLKIGSPCIDAGCNAYVTESNDLDGLPRIYDGRVDIGAYETCVMTNTVGMKFRLMPAGSFTMGDMAGDGDTDERPPHRVNITSPYWIGVYEVTQWDWVQVMGTEPSMFDGDSRPVEQVSWDDAQGFLANLNADESTTTYRLATEAEWEYACRAGTTTKYFFGENSDDIESYAWCTLDATNQTHDVGQKLPNAWGLYDMNGNVFEWTADWWKEDYYQDCVDGPIIDDPPGPATGEYKIARGACWGADITSHRVSYRGPILRSTESGTIGFRIVREYAGP